jgi:hypothetical protein
MKDLSVPFAGTAAPPRVLSIVLALFVLTVTSCRTSVLAPERDSDTAVGPEGVKQPMAPRVDPVLQVPRVVRLRNDVQNGTLVIRGQFVPRLGAPEPFYDPNRPGGWMLQLFLNTDLSDSGYGAGYDYIVRGGEWGPDPGRVVVRRITLDESFPGGWGPQSGIGFLGPRSRSFEISVPLAALGGDDGMLAYGLETYATVACPECPGGVSQEFVEGFVGATSVTGRPVVSRVPVPSPSGHIASLASRHTSSVDRELAASFRVR